MERYPMFFGVGFFHTSRIIYTLLFRKKGATAESTCISPAFTRGKDTCRREERNPHSINLAPTEPVSSF